MTTIETTRIIRTTTRSAVRAKPCARRPRRVPPRRSDRVYTAGQLARDDYARAVVDARTSGTWL
jgi:hypothetical protein